MKECRRGKRKRRRKSQGYNEGMEMNGGDEGMEEETEVEWKLNERNGMG